MIGKGTHEWLERTKTVLARVFLRVRGPGASESRQRQLIWHFAREVRIRLSAGQLRSQVPITPVHAYIKIDQLSCCQLPCHIVLEIRLLTATSQSDCIRQTDGWEVGNQGYCGSVRRFSAL